MKKFTLRFLWFLFPLIILFYIKPLYLLINNKYMGLVAGRETYLSIQKSKKKANAKKIIIGDSVAGQLFPNTKNNDTLNSLASNQAISLVGQFLLLNNYLLTGNVVDTVYLVYSPFSFENNLDQVFTFHYFLKPFYKSEYKPYFTQTVTNQIHKIPFFYLCHEPYILTSNWAPDFVRKDAVNYTFLSPISLEYLEKINQLSKKYHFQLILIPPPTAISNKAEINKMNAAEFLKTDLSKKFTDYFNGITYMSDTIFIDKIHFKHPELYTTLITNRFSM